MTTLADMTSAQAGECADQVLVVPLGATEQHGPHLPLTTDTDIAVALAEGLAARSHVVVAPAVAYGSSGEHQAFPGTLSIGGPAIELLIVELARSATCTWPRLLLVSTHGGNADVVRSAVRQLRDEGRDVRAWFPTWRGDAHAGHTETSIMLALDPARVSNSRAAVGATAPLAELWSSLRTEGVTAVSPNGILGDATTAEAGVGTRLLEDELCALQAFVEAWPA
ncbi:MAG TPA: mycofactocin biosynthesis peptidyl-dipeptidase MftE [Baekduia sp.]|nr:mycofactocin biosynthesis peptidyl-dipeptidase MftE [Baekduia sp.]